MKGSALMSVTHNKTSRRSGETMIRGILEVIAVEAGCRASCHNTWQLQTDHCCNSDYITAFYLDGWIMLDTIKEMDVICCNGGFISAPTVVQFQQKSDPAKSRSGRILGVGYPNPVSGRKSISVHP